MSRIFAASTETSPKTLNRLVKTIVFFGGLTSIGIELSASRLIAPYFGDSTFIWANLIGLTMLYLSIGYALGGRVADRHPEPELLFVLTALAGFAAGVIPIVAHPILQVSLDAFDSVSIGAFYGSLVGVLLLFAVPITLIGFVSPFALRLLVRDVASAGHTSGGLSAVSTFGAIAGSFLPVIVLIPLVGTAKTFYILSIGFMALSVFGLLILRSLRGAVVASSLVGLLLIVIGVFGGGQIKPPYQGELVYETESQYNYIQVLEDNGRFLLALNEGQAIHSIYDPNSILTGGPWDYFTLGPLFSEQFDAAKIQSACIIGLAGGTAARELASAYPGIAIDGVEIDGTIADLGEKYFGMDSVPNLNLIIEDGRYYLNRTSQTYDLVAVDAYHQPYIPFQLTTKEFFETVAGHLNPGGAAVINVGRTETDYRLIDVISATMHSVFPYVFAIDVSGYSNTMLIGLNSPASAEAFARNAELLPEGSIAKPVSIDSLQNGNIRIGPTGGEVFTDDHAPVELVTDLLILDAAREGDKP